MRLPAPGRWARFLQRVAIPKGLNFIQASLEENRAADRGLGMKNVH
ncbi:hypothetical protein AVEN_88078-1, partial [Araneus ventricosus]